MEYKVIPYKGIDGIKFGISEQEIIVKYKSKQLEKSNLGEVIKLTNDELSLTFEKKELVEISIIDNGQSVFLEDVDLFKESNVIEKLNQQYKPIEKLGFIIYNEIGIALAGYVEDEGRKTINIYSEHYWDEILI